MSLLNLTKLSFCIILCYSCSQKEFENQKYEIKQIPFKTTLSNNEMHLYEYDKSYSFSDIILKTNDHINSSYIFEKKNDKLFKIIKSQQGFSNEIYFKYEKDSVYVVSNEKTDTICTIILNASEYPIKVSYNDNTYILLFYDKKMNLLEENYYNNQILQYKSIYNYDDKIGIYKYVNMPKWFLYFFSKEFNEELLSYNNNLINKTISNDDLSPALYEIYYSNDYPIIINYSKSGIDFTQRINYKTIN